VPLVHRALQVLLARQELQELQELLAHRVLQELLVHRELMELLVVVLLEPHLQRRGHNRDI